MEPRSKFSFRTTIVRNMFGNFVMYVDYGLNSVNWLVLVGRLWRFVKLPFLWILVFHWIYFEPGQNKTPSSWVFKAELRAKSFTRPFVESLGHIRLSVVLHDASTIRGQCDRWTTDRMSQATDFGAVFCCCCCCVGWFVETLFRNGYVVSGVFYSWNILFCLGIHVPFSYFYWFYLRNLCKIVNDSKLIIQALW